jgi:hypothetical protein
MSKLRTNCSSFYSFESREFCEEIIRIFHGHPVGEGGVPLKIRYADTPAQKHLKKITTERHQFRATEYKLGAYGSLPNSSAKKSLGRHPQR